MINIHLSYPYTNNENLTLTYFDIVVLDL